MSDPGIYFSENHPYDLNPAWETYLIDRYIDSLGNLYFDSPVPPGNVWQTDNVSSKGRSEEWTIASAFNLYDKLFVGTSLGLAHLKRISTRTYEETPNDPNSRFFDWKLEEELGDTAWGVNFKAGLIYYPASWLRIGAAWHSRTVYAFGEQWSTEIQTTLKNSHGQREVHRYLSPVLYQTYEFHTPHTFTGSLAFIIRQQGMISADVDYMDYGTSWFSFDGVNIRDVLKPTYNFRLGTEWRLRQYYLRGGLAYYGSPYGFGENYGSVKKLGLGFGYAVSQETSWDFAYELTQSTTGFTPYQVYIDGQNIVEDAVRHQWRNKLVVTLKIKIKE
jgi:long-subunit fatty acid transport protein